jgi:ZIP family zinc transporter/zinc and cadmium transporter
MTPLLYALAAAAANLAGAAAVTWRAAWSMRALETVIALAAGFMISVALLDMLPQAYATGGTTAAAVALGGFLAVHLTQHTLAPHFHFGEETHVVSEVVSVSALIGLMMHTTVDGVAIASASAAGASLGALVFLAIALHKLPEGLAIASLFLAAGAGRRRAFIAAGLLGAATVLGALATPHIALLAKWGLALSAGVTLYVGASNLIPEFQAKRGWHLQMGFFAGVALYVAARALVGGAF